MSNFVDLGITTDPNALAEEAFNFLRSAIENYEPNDGNLEVILIETIAPMAAALSEAAGKVPLEIFKNYGEQLLGLQPESGSFATISLTFESQDNKGPYVIPAGTSVNVGEGFAFSTVEEKVIPTGAMTVTVIAAAQETGTEPNELSASATAELIDSLAFVQLVKFNGIVSQGVDPETDLEYANRLASYLTLQAPRPITQNDYSTFVLDADIPVAKGSGLLNVKRAVAIDGYSPGPATLTTTEMEEYAAHTKAIEFEGTIKTGELTLVQEVTSFTNVTVGAEIIDAAGVIPPGTKITAINTGTKVITLSQAATLLHAKENIKVFGSYKNERTVTVFAFGVTGGTGSEAENRKAIRTYLAGSTTTGETVPLIGGVQLPGFREVNFNVYVVPPNETMVNVYYTVHMLPGFSEESVKLAIRSALTEFLNPEKWGAPTAFESATGWQNFNTVRFNKVIGVIEKVPGVDWVSDLKLSSSGLPTPKGNPGTAEAADLTLPGPAPLPKASFRAEVEGKTTSGSEVITGIASTAGMEVGMYIASIEGATATLPAETYITSKTATELTLSKKALASITKAKFTVANHTGTIIAEAS